MPVQQSPTHRPPTTEADIALGQKQRQKKTDQGHTQEHPVALTPRPQRQRQRVVRHSAALPLYSPTGRSKFQQKPEWHAPWKLSRFISYHTYWLCGLAAETGNKWFVLGAADGESILDPASKLSDLVLADGYCR